MKIQNCIDCDDCSSCHDCSSCDNDCDDDTELIYYKSIHIPKYKREKNHIKTKKYNTNYDITKSFKIPLSNIKYLQGDKNKSSSLYLKKTFTTNYIFYISLILCSYIYAKSFKGGTKIIYSFFLTGTIGFFIHMFSHNFSFEHYYTTTANIFKESKYTDTPIRYLIKWFFDFHHRIHHDSDINKQPKLIALEFLNNLFMEGGIIIVMIYLLKNLSIDAIIIWMFIYATVHNINYIINPCIQHIEHHTDYNTNYGFDWYDIIFGTKYDIGKVENYNHMSINVIIGFGLLYLCKKLIGK